MEETKINKNQETRMIETPEDMFWELVGEKAKNIAVLSVIKSDPFFLEKQ